MKKSMRLLLVVVVGIFLISCESTQTKPSIEKPSIEQPDLQMDFSLDMLNEKISGFTVKFGNNSSSLNDKNFQKTMKGVTKTVKSIIKQIPGGNYVYIVGHTTTVGKESKNKALSKRRAYNVYRHLIKKGIKKSKLKYKGVADSEGSKRAVSFVIM